VGCILHLIRVMGKKWVGRLLEAIFVPAV